MLSTIAMSRSVFSATLPLNGESSAVLIVATPKNGAI